MRDVTLLKHDGSGNGFELVNLNGLIGTDANVHRSTMDIDTEILQILSSFGILRFHGYILGIHQTDIDLDRVITQHGIDSS